MVNLNNEAENLELERVFAKDMVSALIETCFDKNELVKKTAYKSLIKYGSKAPNLVVNSLYGHLVPLVITNHQKVDHDRKLRLFEIISDVVDISEINLPSRSQIISLATEELVKVYKKPFVLSQQISSRILINLAKDNADDIAQELLKSFQNNIITPEGVVETTALLFNRNVNGMIPFIGHILKHCLTLCGSIKTELLRISLAKLFGNCCEAILKFIQKDEQVIDNQTFALQLNDIFSTIIKSAWIYSRNLEVSRLTARALGKICLIFDKKTLEEVVSKLIPILLPLFKRHTVDQTMIAASLYDILLSLLKYQSDLFNEFNESISSVLHNEICSSVDQSNSVLKNYESHLRCFGILTENNADFVINFLFNKASSRDDKLRNGNLVVMVYLVANKSDSLSNNEKISIIKGFQKHLNDVNMKIRHNIIKLITAMASNKYLEMEGGKCYVRFILIECSMEVPSIEDSVHENATAAVQLGEWEKQKTKQRKMCSDLLLMMCSLENAEKIFWPYLFEFLVKSKFNNAVGPISEVLYQVSKKKKENGDSNVDKSGLGDVSAADILIRLIVVLCDLKRFPDSSYETILNLLRNVVTYIDLKLVGSWEGQISEMLEFCQNSDLKNKRLVRKSWEEKLLKFLSETLEKINDENWLVTLANMLYVQLQMYPANTQIKNFALRSFGVILSKIKNEEYVKKQLNQVFQIFIFSSVKERHGLAMCVGYSSTSHFDSVYWELQNAVKLFVSTKESSFIFNMFKSEKSLNELENAKATIALTLGHVAHHSSSDLIGKVLESHIIRMLIPLLKGIKSASARSDVAESIGLIASSVYQSCHPEGTIGKILVGANDLVTMDMKSKQVEISPSLNARSDLLSKLVKYFKNEQTGDTEMTKIPIFLTKNIKILRACTALLQLAPALDEAEMKKVLAPCLSYVMGCQVARKGEISYEEILGTNLKELNNLLVTILKKNPNLSCLEFIFNQFDEFLKSKRTYQRLRTVHSCELIFNQFLQLDSYQNIGHHSIVSLIMAKMLPCCGDSSDDIRLKSLMCIQRLLELQNKLEKTTKGNFETLTLIASKLSSTDFVVVYEGIISLGKIVCLRLSREELQYNPKSFTWVLMDGLLSEEATSIISTCFILTHIFETRAAMFEGKIKDIITCIISKLELLGGRSLARDNLLALFGILLDHHINETIETLLEMQLPFSNSICECFIHTGKHESTVFTTVEYLVDLLDKSNPYEEASLASKIFRISSSSSRIASKRSLAISCLIEWLLKSYAINLNETEDCEIHSRFSNPLGGRIVSSLIIRLGSTTNLKSINNIDIYPYKQALEVLRISFLVFFSKKLNNNLENLETWSTKQTASFEVIRSKLILIVMTLCKIEASRVNPIVAEISKFISSSFEFQRATVISFFASIIKESLDEDVDLLLEICMNSFLQLLTDSSHVVRRLCFLGISQIIYASPHQMQIHGPVVVDCLVSGISSENTSDITLQAMTGLRDFLRKSPNINMEIQLANICLRVRPFFQNEAADMRATSFELFGLMSRYINPKTRTKFADQLESSFIQILLHICDEDQQVAKACMFTITEASTVLGNEILSNYLSRNVASIQAEGFYEFANGLSEILISELPCKTNLYIQRCLAFFKSQWADIRCTAAIFAGCLLHHLNEELQDTINKEQIGSEFTQLLKDPNPTVRTHAAHSISLLYCY